MTFGLFGCTGNSVCTAIEHFVVSLTGVSSVGVVSGSCDAGEDMAGSSREGDCMVLRLRAQFNISEIETALPKTSSLMNAAGGVLSAGGPCIFMGGLTSKDVTSRDLAVPAPLGPASQCFS